MIPTNPRRGQTTIDLIKVPPRLLYHRYSTRRASGSAIYPALRRPSRDPRQPGHEAQQASNTFTRAQSSHTWVRQADDPYQGGVKFGLTSQRGQEAGNSVTVLRFSHHAFVTQSHASHAHQTRRFHPFTVHQIVDALHFLFHWPCETQQFQRCQTCSYFRLFCLGCEHWQRCVVRHCQPV